MCRIKDFDWLSGAAPESSEVMGGKRGERERERETERERERQMEKL